MPRIDVLHPVQSPSPFTRLGAKGIAEGNQYSTPVCIANAVADALDRSDITTPLLPAKVMAWLNPEERPPRTRPAEPEKPRRGLAGSGSVIVPAPPETVWPALLEPDTLRKAIPGCEEIARAGENAYRATVLLGVGPVRGRFAANVELSELDPPRAGVLSGTLEGPLGAGSGRGRLVLASDSGGCRISYDYDVHLTGKVAMVGGRLIEAATRHLIGEFFRRFAQAAAPAAQTNGSQSIWRRLFGRGP
jgi:2-furoyl-CoA dehydrogenase large subunit